MRLGGNDAAQLLQLEAKHSTHPHITRNVTDGRGLSGGWMISLGSHYSDYFIYFKDPGRLVENREAIAAAVSL